MERETLRTYCHRTNMEYLLDEWDAEKNVRFTPDTVTPGSSDKEIWWRCRKGHSWKTQVYLRTKRKTGCPFCAGMRVLAGENDLAATTPELCASWDREKNAPLTPEQVSRSSGRLVWWRCENGHSWRASVSSRAKGAGCPICTKRKLRTGCNDLRTCYPKLAEQWDVEKNGCTPEQALAYAKNSVYWRCSLGHSWEEGIAARIYKHTECPYCSGKKALAGFNDIVSRRPDLAAEWDYEKNGVLKPEQVTEDSDRTAWWRCSKGHRWRARIRDREQGEGCPICEAAARRNKENDLRSRYPALAAEWDTEKNGCAPEQVIVTENKRAWWRCKLGHSWEANIACRIRDQSGCPYCTGRKVLAGFNDLASRNPAIAAEWDYEKNGTLRPEQVVATSSRNVWWRCPLGHSYRSQISSRTTKNQGCPYCERKKVLAGFNDLASQFPEIAAEWEPALNAPLTPETVLSSSSKMVHWRCAKGHIWYEAICARTGPNRHSCPTCAEQHRSEISNTIEEQKTVMDKEHGTRNLAGILQKNE